MRSTALLLTALLALSSGCLEDKQAPEATPDAPAPVMNATAPTPLHWEGDVTAGADPFNAIPVVAPPECSQSVSACEFYDFTINGTFDIDASLVWTNPANDLDLYLYQGETFIGNEGINNVGDPPGPTSQNLVHADLPPGDYTFRVVMWNAVNEHYDLDVTFT
jgi:hypothetical protein